VPTTFDHVGTSDPRFFDRLWFAASDRRGGATLQFTMGVYQNMNVVDGGMVAIHDGRQHNVRVSRQLRPAYDTVCGPLGIEVLEPLHRIRLTASPNDSTVEGELEWVATSGAQEERHHFARRTGRVIEDYSRYDQIGEMSGWLGIDGERLDVDSWWSCRDHSWGVRERVGIPEPNTGQGWSGPGALFAFLFYSTDTHSGHVQLSRRDQVDHITAEILDSAAGTSVIGGRISVAVSFVDDRRPRRFDRAVFDVTTEGGGMTSIQAEADGPAVAMPGLGYGGYADGFGLGVYRGTRHLEHDVWDVSHPADVGYPDGSTGRPVHRIQPVRVTQRSPSGTSHGTGSLTFIAEVDPDPNGVLRVAAG
jgi:hypothetical protein